MSELELEPSSALPILTGFIRDEVRKTGLKHVVLGLSGGVDSALVAGLAARALGGSNVMGVMMPYRTSSPDSLAHAKSVARKFRIRSQQISITAQVDPYFRRFPRISNRRRGNKMSRERMSILYDQSVAFEGLVLGTSNKTELLLGYGTQHGDLASALNPLGDLYKAQVWQLSREIGVPEAVIKKAPSADLWEGQTDEQELGFAYEKVDRLLYWMVDQRADREELAARGFEESFVRRVQALVRGSQFKRRLPLIAKLSGRTVGREFRYARDWGL
jgi:NAD+ synthase